MILFNIGLIRGLPHRFARRVSAIFIMALAAGFLTVQSASGNIAGGFTTTVTTAVTTGTEAFGSQTDHFLDNGILHVLISPNGSVDSIKYLKPGLTGTPKANGTETVSQSGANFGNHTAIYYYWYPDGNGDCVYSRTTTGSTNVDIAYLRTFNPASDKVVADVELHYLLGKGNSGLYGYLIVKHPANYLNWGTNLDISFIQVLWPTAHDTVNFLCEDSYVDDGVRYGLTLGGVHQKRNGLQPNFYDNWHTTNLLVVAGNMTLPQEIVKYQTGVFAGSTNCKYSFTFDYPKLNTFGMASDINKIGLWYVMGGHEYQQNGPTANEYSGGIGGIITFEPLIAHYGNTGLNVGTNQNFTKIYGPWLFYINSQSNGAACWGDSQQQGLAEQKAWPYAWLTNGVYQAGNQRALVSGKLVISDPLRPQANAAGAWIGLAAPDAGLENDPNDWQLQSDGYQFWTQCAADGTFTLPPVTTFSPYGTNATYELYAYCAGTNGSVGQFQTGPFTFAPGTVTNLGTLTWTVPHQGNSIAWEIGIPDRTAGEFRNGDDYAIPALWLDFTNEFPNPMTYTVGASNWTNDWNYVQGAYITNVVNTIVTNIVSGGVTNTVTYYVTNGVLNNMIWHIKFYMTNLPSSGNFTLNTIWAGAAGAAIQVFVNNPAATGNPFRDFYPNVPGGADTLIRQGIHDKYGMDHTSIPASKFNPAITNDITLVQRRAISGLANYVMYDYVNLELPTPIAPPGLAATAGPALVLLNWQAVPGATSYLLKRSLSNGGPYTVITNLAANSYSDQAVLNGTNYFYVVAATNSTGSSGNSASVNARPVATNSPAFNFNTAGGQLQFAWPADHTGWRLVMQTNALQTGLSTNWVTVNASMSTNFVQLPVIPANGNVFFRLVYP